MDLIRGLHHVTACVDGAQDDVDFYTKVVGQRLIKQTVLLDGDSPFYHLYYATDRDGSEGSVMTSFPFRGKRSGRLGSGQVKTTSYTVPVGSLDFWRKRMERLTVPHQEISERLGQRYLRVTHPGGIAIDFIEDDQDQRPPSLFGDVGPEAAVRGFHSVTLSLRDTADSVDFMYALGFRLVAEEGPWTRFEIGEGGPGRTVEFLHEPDLPAGSWTYAAGTYHHVAFAVDREADHQTIKGHLDGLGYIDMSEIKDRNYFRSSYVRMPGGVLFEFATTDPKGFAKDEPVESMGQELQLPPWKEDERARMLQELEPITTNN